ncbi:MerR family transcriptional regulator [Acidovorax sp. Root402]|uniref:MerR family transcriptional regulator n=1 Tax=Acidovorax sp. Root402 TaxID=1736527 RepID=UPI0009EA2ABF|nr:MerR family transcriptional regulator [Acidovorax sp. Root402]
MRIGELAQRTGTTPKAIRLYEARGLLGTVARAGSYRHYGEADVARVLLIRQAQALGFRLSELDGLPHIDTAAGWERMAQLVAGRRAAVAQELARLSALDAQLALLEAELHTCDTWPCPWHPKPALRPPHWRWHLQRTTPRNLVQLPRRALRDSPRLDLTA